MTERPFLPSYGRGFAVMPTADHLEAMSLERQARLLEGLDPVLVLEAASTLISDIESRRGHEIRRRLPRRDQEALTRWYAQAKREGSNPASTPIHAISVLAATTLALAQSRPSGSRADSDRDAIVRALAVVALRYNGLVLGAADDDDSVLAYMSRSAHWKAVGDEDWMIWSGELVGELELDPEADALREAFQNANGLTITEWWYRGFGERATRATHGARSWGPALHVNPKIEAAWERLTTALVDETVEAAKNCVVRRHRTSPPEVADPYDLTWLASKPAVRTPDGRRFQVWLDANNRCLLPAGVADTIATSTGIDYRLVAARLGRCAERLLMASVSAMPLLSGEVRVPEAVVPATNSKCDDLVQHKGTLVGFEYTMSTPTRRLSAGDPAAVPSLVSKFADKLEQAYATFRWYDPEHTLRWLPVLVLESPTVVDALLNERVHQELVRRGSINADGASELMTCHVPHFLDLLQHARSQNMSSAEAVRSWRDSELRGASLEWWLSDHGALRSSARLRIAAVTDRADGVLTTLT